ncbi:MAG: hypothetical protein HY907_15400, partial [Deltaproteobacteria bacterium]|nr:hypothetical protein [Deltaproteobacteria bacterium]
GVGPDVGDGDGERGEVGEEGETGEEDGGEEVGAEDGGGDEEGEAGPFCGNGVVESGEACDGDDLGGSRCEDFGRLPGVLACTEGCMFDLAGCPPPVSCGNGILESGELCDGSELGGIGCTDLGFGAGVLACAGDCTFDTAGCLEACADECPAVDALRCVATVLERCVAGADGCRVWTTERDCGAEAMVCHPAPGAERCLGGAGDSCDSPQVVGALPVNESGGDVTAVFHNYQEFTGSRCDTASGVEAVFVRWMVAGESVRIRETGNMDAVLRVLAECSDAAACLASRNDPENPGLTFTAPSDGNYYFVVEAFHATPASRGYNITIEDSPGGDTCPDPLWGDPLPVNVHGGDIRTAYTDDVRFSGPGCTPADGVDVVLARPMRAGETVRLRETGNLDSVLRVLAACDPTAACLASRDDPESPGLAFTAPGDGLYYFVVEAKLAVPASVGYDITLEDAPDGDLCTDAILADPLPVNVSGGDIRTVVTNDVRFTGAGCSPAEGVDMFFRRDMAAGETARIRDVGNADLVLRVVSSCDPAAPCLADRDSPENPGLTYTAPSAGTYWFVAEALLAAPASVGYNVTVDDPPAGELCTDPLPAAVGTTLSGGDFTAAFTDDVNFTGMGCSYAGGAEVVLTVTMAEGETLRVNELGTLDVVIRVLETCEATASCLYDQDLPENPGVLFVAPSAGTYYIVIESVLAFPASRGYDIRVAAT